MRASAPGSCYGTDPRFGGRNGGCDPLPYRLDDYRRCLSYRVRRWAGAIARSVTYPRSRGEGGWASRCSSHGVHAAGRHRPTGRVDYPHWYFSVLRDIPPSDNPAPEWGGNCVCQWWPARRRGDILGHYSFGSQFHLAGSPCPVAVLDPCGGPGDPWMALRAAVMGTPYFCGRADRTFAFLCGFLEQNSLRPKAREPLGRSAGQPY